MTAPRAIDRPEPCLRQIKLAKGGVWLAARIHRTCHCTPNGGDDGAPHDWRGSCDRYPQLEAEIDGKPASVGRVWTSGEAIDEAEYLYLMADRAHACRHRPDSPEANPRQPIDFDTLPPPF